MIGIIAKILGKSKSESQVIEEIHNEFDTAPDRLLQQALTIINENKNGIVSLESQMLNKATRLEKLGFVKNGLVAKKLDVSKRNKGKEDRIQMELEQAKQIEYYSKTYPFMKFLTENELDRICDKYGLVYAPVNHYKMPVPDKNLSEIEDAQSLKMSDIPININYVHYNVYNWSSRYRNQYVNPSDTETWENPLRIDTNNTISESELRSILHKKYGYTKTLHFTGSIEINKQDKSGLFIAAPKKHFDLKGLKFDKKKGYFSFTKTIVQTDPIVFRYVKGGIQVLSKWGLEANDPALQVEILN